MVDGQFDVIQTMFNVGFFKDTLTVQIVYPLPLFLAVCYTIYVK